MADGRARAAEEHMVGPYSALYMNPLMRTNQNLMKNNNSLQGHASDSPKDLLVSLPLKGPSAPTSPHWGPSSFDPRGPNHIQTIAHITLDTTSSELVIVDDNYQLSHLSCAHQRNKQKKNA